MRRPDRVAGATIAALLLAALPILKIELTPGSNTGVPQDIQAVKGLNVLSAAIGEGAIAPTEIVRGNGRAGGASDPQVQAAIQRLAVELRNDPEVADVISGKGSSCVDSTGRYFRVSAIGRHDYGMPESQKFVDRVRGDIVPAAGFAHSRRGPARG